MTEGLGHARRRLVIKIIEQTWMVKDPSERKYTYRDILFIVQEMFSNSGLKYIEEQSKTPSNRGYGTFKSFVEHMFYRNLANYDSMVLLTSEKGCITDDSRILIDDKDIIRSKTIKELLNKGPIRVLSYNFKNKSFEVKESDGVEFAKHDNVFELVTEDYFGELHKIKGTKDHPFMCADGTYKHLGDFKKGEQIISYDLGERQIRKVKEINYIGKQNVYDIVNVRDNHNFIANGFVVSNTGKCLYINSNTDFVVSADGRLVHPDDAKEIVCMDENFKLTNCKVKKHYSRISKEVFELKLRSGKKICLTKEHPLRTLNDWKQLQNLVPGEFIATPRKYNLNNNKVMNEGLVKVLAYLIADGFMGGLKLEFTKNDEKIRQDFKEALHDYDPTLSWGNSVRIISTLPNTYNSRGFLPRNGLITYLQSIGLYEKRSGDKFIPQEILELNNELISLFINRLFSCDGCVELRDLVNKRNKSNNKCFFGEITYTSKSELLIRQLQHVLLRFSIISKITSKFKRATNSVNHKGEYYWQLTISGKENIINFRNNINFFQEDKKAKLEKLYEHALAIKSNTNVDVIPKEVFANYTFKCEQKEYAKYLNIKQFQTSVIKKNNMSRSRLEELNVLENNDYFDTLVNSDIFWDRIESITKLDQKDVKVYDLEVNNDNHNFVCNDIIVHNSSSAIMIGREWCLLLGIRFNPARHIAYSNKEVTEKIDALNKFEPIVCLSGDTKIIISDQEIAGIWNQKEVKLKELVGKKDYYVLTYNLNKNIYKFEKPTKTILTKKDAEVYELELSSGEILKATKEHLIYIHNKGYVELQNINPHKDRVQTIGGPKQINHINKLSKREDVYDIIGVPDNHNFVANGMVVHNCDEAIRFALAAEWAKKENKELKKKLAQVRTKHLLFVLCFPLKIHKIEKVYLECLDGDTIISTEEGKIKIKDLEGRTNFKVWSYNKDTKDIELRVAEKCVKTKIDYVWKVEFDNATFVEATEDHLFLTNNGWKKLKHLDLNLDSILNKDKTYNKIISITKGTSREVYDILNVEHNYNYVANDLISHNSFCNYWVDLFGRGVGAIYVKDKNPVNDSWRLNDFKLVGSYTEFTSLDTIEKKLKQHPNFWRIIKFPKPPEWLYNKYLEVREKNVYDEEAVRNTVSIEDVHNALLVLSLQDVMTNDTTINLDRISLHMKNKYNIPISKKNIRDRIIDAKQLIDKIREEQM